MTNDFKPFRVNLALNILISSWFAASLLVERGVQRRIPVAVPLQVSATFVLQVTGALLQCILFDNKHGLHLESAIVGLGSLSKWPRRDKKWRVV